MAMIERRIKELEKFTGTSEPEPITVTVTGYALNAFELTIGRDKETLERKPGESELDFVARCESYAKSKAPRSKGSFTAPVPILFQKTPSHGLKPGGTFTYTSPATGAPITITRGVGNEQH